MTSEQSQQKKSSQNENSSAVAMKRTSNSNLIPLNNAEGIYDEKKGSSWVKIATIWDPELTLYDTESYVKDTKAIAVTFDVTGLDIKDMKCYCSNFFRICDTDCISYFNFHCRCCRSIRENEL